MFSIKLYTTDPAVLQREKIEAALAIFDYNRPVRVSRTVGPANWFTLNKQDLAAEEGISFPIEDIERAQYNSFSEVSALSRPQSVLTVSCAGVKSARMQALSSALHTDVPAEANGFFISSALFSFGPSDIVDQTEDREGQIDVVLVDVAQFSFSLSCDRFPGRYDLFKTAVPKVGEFAKLRGDLERIIGPLKLFFPQ